MQVAKPGIASVLLVHCRVGFPHFLGLGAGGFDLDERALADAGAIARGLAPLGAVSDHLRPEREDATLDRFHGVDGASAIAQEMALRLARDPQAELAAGAVAVALLEFARAHAQVFGDADGIGVGEIDEAFLRAAGGAPGLAGKTEPLGHVLIMRQRAGRLRRMGAERGATRGVARSSPGERYHGGMGIAEGMWAPLRVALAAGFLLISTGCDQHLLVTRQMGWQCTMVEDTGNAQFPHVEGVKMWFLENPRYEVRASGPSLCAELKAVGRPEVAATFKVWGNRIEGLHGWDLAGITAGSKTLTLYGSGSGGFHGDPEYGNFDSKVDQRMHPEVYRFPLEVFR